MRPATAYRDRWPGADLGPLVRVGLFRRENIMFGHYSETDDTATKIGYVIGDAIGAFVSLFVLYILFVQFVRF